MNDKDIDQLLKVMLEQSTPEPDQEAKQRAIALAKNTFNEEFAQGFESSARPIDTASQNQEQNHAGFWHSGLSKSIRSHFMNFFSNRTAYNAFGTAAIAFVAISLVYVMPSLQTETRVTNVPTSKDASKGSLRGTPSEILNEARESESVSTTQLEEVIATTSNVMGDQQSSSSRHESRQPALLKEHSSVEQLLDAVREGSLKKTHPDKANQGPVVGAQAVGQRAKQVKRRETQQLQRPNSGLAPNVASGDLMRKSMPQTESFAEAPMAAIIASPPVSIDIAPSTPLGRLDNDEEYAKYTANPIVQVSEKPVSTFSIDVDTASYSLVRNQLESGRLPKPQAVRAEEMINYFDYAYGGPKTKKQPFQTSLSVFDSPWNAERKLVHIGIKGYEMPAKQTPDSNIVFLLDVSGSMNSANKLPLVKQSLGLLLDTLKPSDKVSIVVYAGAAGTVLEPTEVKHRNKIMQALQKLNAGGSTAGGAGISLAYQLAEQNLLAEGVNRIILATDGDFNVGQTSNEDLKTLVERKRDSGIFLSVLGFGRNNYQDDMMQTLAQNGNGVAAYIDTLSEAKKVLLDEATSTLFPIAKDVKIQLEFNPATVSEYRLIGYETRALRREDFNNDKVDAGDIGAGHTVTAIYEITPVDAKNKAIDSARYSANQSTVKADNSEEYGFLKMRYKLPNGKKSILIETPILKSSRSDGKSSSEAEFSIAVAGFAQLLTGSPYVPQLDYDQVIEAALEHKGRDPFGYRSEFVQLARMAKIARQ